MIRPCSLWATIILSLSLIVSGTTLGYPRSQFSVCIDLQQTVRRPASQLLSFETLVAANQWFSVEPPSSNIRELIAPKFRKRYLKWKSDYLSTVVGLNQWNRYAHDPNFVLTVTVSTSRHEGALVDQFQWDNDHHLIAATITLGDRLDSGYPSSINYPITCSLAPGNLPPEVKGTILAATKLAHEFGHLDKFMEMDGRFYDLQNRLMLEYIRIFNSNGHNTEDPQLLDMAQQMKGTPVSIAQDRESWAEIGALLYLQERLGKTANLKMPDPIREAINGYRLQYPDRVYGEPQH